MLGLVRLLAAYILADGSLALEGGIFFYQPVHHRKSIVWQRVTTDLQSRESLQALHPLNERHSYKIGLTGS